MVVAGDQVSTDPELVATQTEIAQLNENIQHTLNYNKPSSEHGNQGGGYRKRKCRRTRRKRSRKSKSKYGKRSRGKRSRGKRSRNMRKSRRRR